MNRITGIRTVLLAGSILLISPARAFQDSSGIRRVAPSEDDTPAKADSSVLTPPSYLAPGRYVVTDPFSLPIPLATATSLSLAPHRSAVRIHNWSRLFSAKYQHPPMLSRSEAPHLLGVSHWAYDAAMIRSWRGGQGQHGDIVLPY